MAVAGKYSNILEIIKLEKWRPDLWPGVEEEAEVGEGTGVAIKGQHEGSL